MEDEEHHLRTFNDLLYDSVYLLYFAFDIDQSKYNDDVISPLIRSSVINSILLLECGANCLIDSLDLPAKFYNDIEKFPFLSKYEYFLHSNNKNQKFDRGCAHIQRISELKTIRDVYVHPKVRKSKYEKVGEHIWSSDFGHTKQMKFPRDPGEWTKGHAIDALKTVNDFFNLYFLEWCGFRVDLVVDLLLSNEKVNYEYPVGAAIDCIGGLDRAVKDWNIDFKFIGK